MGGEKIAVEVVSFISNMWGNIPLWYRILIHIVLSVWFIGKFFNISLKIAEVKKEGERRKEECGDGELRQSDSPHD